MSICHDSRRARRSRSRRSALTTVGALVASAALGGSAVAAEARQVLPADLDRLFTRTERMLGAWESPQSVLEASHRLYLVPADLASPRRLEATQAGTNQPVQDPPSVFRFSIPQGLLTDALRQFEAATGVDVTVSSDVARGLSTAGVSGSFTADQALARLLAGSGLSHRFTAPAVAVVEIRIASDSVEVSGAIPRLASSKYTTALVETPQTVQIIPRALIEEQGATTLSEALRNVPGITMQAGEGGGASSTSGDMFNMRGFSAANSLFVDGVRDDGLVSRDVFNLEQVEVFSGPTGSDVGRTNAAGYINLTTKSPGLGSNRAATVAYGSGEAVRATFDVNQRLDLGEPGSFLGNSAVRVNLLWQDGGVAGRDEAGRESRSIAPSLAMGIGTSTRLTVSGQIMRQDNLADYGMPAAASPIGPLTPTGIVADAPVDQTNFYGSPAFDYDRVRQDNVTARIEHDLRPGVTLRNQTRYNETSREAVVSAITSANSYDPETNLLNVARQVNYRDNDVLSNQTNLSARVTTGTIAHDLSLGLELSAETYRAPGMTGAGTRPGFDLHHPDPSTPVIGMNIVPNGGVSEGTTDTVAFYLFDGVDLGRRVRLNGGIRVERYDTTSHAVNANSGVVTDLDGAGTLVSGKAGLVYRLSGQGNLYASYGSSLTPPGSSNFQLNANLTNQNNPNVDPQKSTHYEVGTKWDLAQGRLLLNGAFFYTENENVIFVIDSGAVPPVFNQDNGQRIRGAAFGLVGRPLPFWDVNFSAQYLDSENVNQNPALSGKRLTLTPGFSGSLWTTFRLPHDVRVGGGLRQTDKVFVNTANTTVVPGYTVVDALVEVPIGPRLVVRLNASNLTDKVYIRSINNNGGRYNLGTPRAFLLTTAIRF